MGLKISIMFQLGNTGWSETHYRNDSLAGFNMQTFSNTLFQKRRAMLSPQVKIVAIRVSDLANPRQVKVLPLNWSGSYAQGFSGLGPNDSDFSFVSVMAKMGTADGFRRNVYLRGVPDIVTDSNYRIVTTNPWKDFFNQWATWITSGNFSCWAVSPADNPPSVIEDITVVNKKIRIDANWTTAFDGQVVRISKLVSSPPLNGVWRIKKIDDSTADLIGSDTALTAIPFDYGGEVRGMVHSLHTITSCEQAKITEHKAGRPFDMPRSRRRKPAPKLPQSLMGSY